MLDAKSEHLAAQVVDEARALLGADLVTVALYGSAAGGDFVPGQSDINIVIVLARLRFSHLQTLRQRLPEWQKKGIATPLLVDRDFLANAADVFPMELHDLANSHRVLYGDDVLARLAVRPQHLRYQCEQEARGKLLRLHEVYLEIGGDRQKLRALMLDSLKTFLIIMRHLNRLRGSAASTSYESDLRTFTEGFGCALPVVSRLLRIKLSKEKWSGAEEEIFREYWEELQQLATLIDQLPEDASPPETTG